MTTLTARAVSFSISFSQHACGNPLRCAAKAPSKPEPSVVKEQVLMKEAYGKSKELTTGIQHSPEGDGPLLDFYVAGSLRRG